MSVKTKIPKSKARTAYGLLSEIAALALEEPKRIAMSDWLITPATAADFGLELPEGFPACQTVGCVAGWAITLKPTPARTIRPDPTDAFYDYKEGEGDRAARLLGLTKKQAGQLFVPTRLVEAFNQQTPEHAADVVAHIRKFQKRYRAQLLAKRL